MSDKEYGEFLETNNIDDFSEGFDIWEKAMITTCQGTDLDIGTCIYEAYVMIQSKGLQFTTGTEVRVLQVNPMHEGDIELDELDEQIIDELKENGFLLDVTLNWEELVSLYYDNKDDINECCDRESEGIPTDWHDFLRLASDVQWYCGLY